MKILFNSTLDKCKERERELRPYPRIGWNDETGGHRGYPAGWYLHPHFLPCKLYWIYDSSFHTDPKREGYIGITSQNPRIRFYYHRRRWPDLQFEEEE
jgi:hypothetical protein